MARALRVLAAATLLVLPLAACSLLVDTSGLGGDDVSGDAATTVADGAADTSSSSDAPAADATDAAAGEDGDGGADVDSSVAPCSPSATRICDAFDDSTPGSTWTSKDMNRGTVAFDAVGLSLPHALHAKVTAGSGAGDATLVQTYPSTRTNVRCDLDLKLFDVPSAGEIDVIDFITDLSGGQGYHVYFARFDTTWAVAEFQGSSSPDGGVDREANLSTALPVNTWFHVAFVQTGATVTLTANATVTTLGSLAIPAGTATSVDVGITYASATVQSADVAIDNVDCTVLP